MDYLLWNSKTALKSSQVKNLRDRGFIVLDHGLDLFSFYQPSTLSITLAEVLSIVPHAANTYQFIEEAEILRFSESIAKPHSFSRGDSVRVSGFGNLPFIILDTSDDEAELQASIFGITLKWHSKLANLSPFSDSANYVFNPTFTFTPSGTAFVDLDFITRARGSSLPDIVSALLYFKLLYPSYIVVLYIPSDFIYKSELALLQSIFNFPIVNSFMRASIYVTDLPLSPSISSRFIFDLPEGLYSWRFSALKSCYPMLEPSESLLSYLDTFSSLSSLAIAYPKLSSFKFFDDCSNETPFNSKLLLKTAYHGLATSSDSRMSYSIPTLDVSLFFKNGLDRLYFNFPRYYGSILY